MSLRERTVLRVDRVELVDGSGRRWRVDVARRHSERIRGLLGQAALATDAGLLLPRTRSIHTFGMRYAISVVWLASDGRVVAVRRLPPRRLALPRRGARHLLECAAGAAPRVGDRLEGIVDG